jgi:tetratricopeptide (TPR) repeat protein
LELRRAWELAPNPVQLAERWVRWFESPRQMAEAMPRAAGALGGPDLGTVVRVLPLVRSARGDGFARELLSSVPADAPANPRERLRIARLAGSLGALEQAVDVLRELVREPEASQKAVLSALELLRDLDRSDLALSWIDDWQVRQGHRELPQRFCLFRASVALDQGEPREAAETLDGCSQSRSKPPSANPKWVRLRARADAEAGDPRAALSRLDDLFQQFPHDLALRRERALYLLESGRTAEARLEANYVLRRSPEDGRARAVLRELDRMRRAGTAP